MKHKIENFENKVEKEKQNLWEKTKVKFSSGVAFTLLLLGAFAAFEMTKATTENQWGAKELLLLVQTYLPTVFFGMSAGFAVYTFADELEKTSLDARIEKKATKKIIKAENKINKKQSKNKENDLTL